MTISPAPRFPERAPQIYERKGADNATRRGPLRFEEGVATDTDVPNDFQVGICHLVLQQHQVVQTAMLQYGTKTAAETLSERAHVGSASWVEAPTFLGEFAHGTMNDYSAAQV
jgi:hypothetical protein